MACVTDSARAALCRDSEAAVHLETISTFIIFFTSMIFLCPTDGAKLVMKKWIKEMQIQPWSRTQKSNDQPAFNWALMKITKENTHLEEDVKKLKGSAQPSRVTSPHACT